MNKYNFKTKFVINHKNSTGKSNFKTIDRSWIGTKSPVIIPISIHSSFHSGIKGEMKMETLLTAIKQNTQGPITVLLADEAHVNVEKLNHKNAEHICKKDSIALAKRFEQLFHGCKVANWKEYTKDHSNYSAYRKKLLDLYNNNNEFREKITNDAHLTYTDERKKEYPSGKQFIYETIKDLLEGCIFLRIVYEKGYRFLFYPGKQYPTYQYISDRYEPIRFVESAIEITNIKTNEAKRCHCHPSI